MLAAAMARGRGSPSFQNRNHSSNHGRVGLLMAPVPHPQVEPDTMDEATIFSSHPSEKDLREMEASDPEQLASWIGRYQQQLKLTTESCSELERDIEMTTKELQRLMFPVFLEHLKTDILPSSEMDSFYHRNPFADIDQKMKRIVWESSSFAGCFFDEALAYLRNSGSNNNMDVDLLNMSFLCNNWQVLWEEYGMGVIVQEHHADWQETTAFRIQQAVDAVVGDRLDAAQAIYKSTTETGYPSLKPDMLPILDRLYCYAGRAQGASRGIRAAYSFSTEQQAFILTVTRKHLQTRFPSVMYGDKEDAKALSFSSCFFAPVHDDDDYGDDDDELAFQSDTFRWVTFGASDAAYYFEMKERLSIMDHNDDTNSVDKAEKENRKAVPNSQATTSVMVFEASPPVAAAVVPRVSLRIVTPEKLQQPTPGESLASGRESEGSSPTKRSLFTGVASSSGMVAAASGQVTGAGGASPKRIKKDGGWPELPKRKLAMRKMPPAERITFRW